MIFNRWGWVIKSLLLSRRRKALLDNECVDMVDVGNGAAQCRAGWLLQRGRTALVPCIPRDVLQPRASDSAEGRDTAGVIHCCP